MVANAIGSPSLSPGTMSALARLDYAAAIVSAISLLVTLALTFAVL